MEYLVSRFGELVHLAALENDRVIYVDKIQGTRSVQVAVTGVGVTRHSGAGRGSGDPGPGGADSPPDMEALTNVYREAKARTAPPGSGAIIALDYRDYRDGL